MEDKIDRVGMSVDPEFASLCPDLDDEESARLSDSLAKEGCRDPILYWVSDGKRWLVDGHNRYKKCLETGIQYRAVEMHFANRYEVIEWIVNNQLARRNLTPVMKIMLLAKLHEASKAAAAAQSSDEGDTMSLRTPEQVGSATKPLRNIAKEVAEKAGVSTRQVHRATKMANALDRLAQKSPQLRDAAVSGDIRQCDAQLLAEADVEVLRAIEARPAEEQKSAARAAADAIKTGGASRPPKPGRPAIDMRPISELEQAMGKVVRAKTEALKACGGKACEWAKRHDEDLRHLLNQAFEIILQWKKDASVKGL